MTRRTFMQAMAGAGAMVVAPFAKARQWVVIRRFTVTGLEAPTADGEREAARWNVKPTRVEGPPPDGLINGTYGVHRFDATNPDHFGKIRVFLDGVDVTNRASACDSLAGWVRMYDVRCGSKGQMILDCSGESIIQRIHFGKVEVR